MANSPDLTIHVVVDDDRNRLREFQGDEGVASDHDLAHESRLVKCLPGPGRHEPEDRGLHARARFARLSTNSLHVRGVVRSRNTMSPAPSTNQCISMLSLKAT